MTGILLRVLLYVIIFGAIYIGLRRIINDWRDRFRDVDKQTRERDLKESKKPGIIDLERDKDGIFRPGDDDKDKE